MKDRTHLYDVIAFYIARVFGAGSVALCIGLFFARGAPEWLRVFVQLVFFWVFIDEVCIILWRNPWQRRGG